ncbi:SDR family NAD(P)-dependent oxidoreductase [Flavobacterium beibuense]|uniref:Short-chain dehydrogenase/reductase SDR n=1 Tax=Flavobacterium beibuense TaxID=657326 RepID=A0A444WIP0_9FLAO|nr:SDR family NAD(P)-dependent oxidoreductase [Flavobacterium beibuense]RYJ45655.1 Short-chain dehydrogenase/reductase SDR [Flavobacterium beibuense]
MESKKEQKVWFVTGASKGLGLSIVKQLLKLNQKVAATSRNKEALIKAVDFTGDNFLPLEVNLADNESVNAAIMKTNDVFSSVDVLINNAGYGIGGSLEELNDKEVRDSFDVNVFGTINTIRNVLPYMRKQKSGHIINISSIAGFAPGIGWTAYAATKFAVAGLTEALAQDVKELGIKATAVLPGAFRTSFLTDESLFLSENVIPDYTAIRETHSIFKAKDGHQQGDPEKGSAVIIETGFNPEPPVFLLIGSDAYNRAKTKIEDLTNQIGVSKDITTSTDF